MKVLLHQRKITNYRESFFNRLSKQKGINLLVTHYDLSFQEKEESFRQNESFSFDTINLSKTNRKYPLLFTIKKTTPDIIILGDFRFIEDLLISVYCKINRIPILRWTGGFVVSTSTKKNLNTFYKTYIQRILKSYYPTKFVLLHLNSGFIVYSEFAKEFIQNTLKIRKRVFIAPNSPDTDALYTIKSNVEQNPEILNEIREQFQIEGYKTLLLIGRLNKERRIDLLLDVFKAVQQEYPKTSLFIIGEGEYLDTARKEAETKKLNKVFFTGAVYDENKLGIYYSLSDIYLTTGVASLTIKSAMTYGKPVVSMDNGLEIHAIRDGFNGYIVEPGNVKEMAGKILYLLNNDLKRVEMGLNSTSMVMDFLNITKMTDGFIKAIDSVAKNN
jgi:glycosyltransferase involved in cell wall biosynthesis